MQHYDCPTRSLDVTTNPLVALFFACKNFGCTKCDESQSGAVYILAVAPGDDVYSDSNRAIMLACLAKFTFAKKKNSEN